MRQACFSLNAFTHLYACAGFHTDVILKRKDRIIIHMELYVYIYYITLTYDNYGAALWALRGGQNKHHKGNGSSTFIFILLLFSMGADTVELKCWSSLYCWWTKRRPPFSPVYAEIWIKSLLILKSMSPKDHWHMKLQLFPMYGDIFFLKQGQACASRSVTL